MQIFILSAANSLSEIPPVFWAASLIGITCAVVLGFVSGLYYSHSADEKALEKASKEFQKLFDLTVMRLKQANQACAQLEKFSENNFREKETKILDHLKSTLSEKLSNCLFIKTKVEEVVEKVEEEVQPIVWDSEISDPVTDLPKEKSTKNNLNMMLEYSRSSGRNCSTLLCSIDKLDKLESRVGKANCDHFRKKLSSLLIRTVTEQDLVCQLDQSTFMILVPDLTVEEASELTEKVIRSVRGYHFRSLETDREVLVTASFGFTTCLPQDTFDTVIGRVRNAVTKSERRGRNQLHIHDGDRAIHTLVS